MRTKFLVGGVAVLGGSVAAFLANRKAAETVKTMENAVKGLDKEGTSVLPAGSGVTVPVRITGYWPFKPGLDAKQRLMEGGKFDRGMPDGYKDKPDSPQYKKHILRTLEDFQAGKTEFVSVSGDFTIFPYGQRIALSQWPGVVFRVVDTGGHFFDDPKKNAHKVFRITGREPFDVCVLSPDTHVVAVQDATIYPGDHFAKGTHDVALEKIGKPQTAVGCCGFDILGIEG